MRPVLGRAGDGHVARYRDHRDVVLLAELLGCRQWRPRTAWKARVRGRSRKVCPQSPAPR